MLFLAFLHISSRAKLVIRFCSPRTRAVFTIPSLVLARLRLFVFGEKVLCPDIAQEPQFLYEKEGQFVINDTGFIMTGEQLLLLTGIFHSNVFTYVYSKFYSGGGLGDKGYRYKKAFFENTPVPLIDSSNNHLRLIN